MPELCDTRQDSWSTQGAGQQGMGCTCFGRGILRFEAQQATQKATCCESKHNVMQQLCGHHVTEQAQQ